MSGDYSRFTFDPHNDFSGVLMQQGRVQLDADWNELVAISTALARRPLTLSVAASSPEKRRMHSKSSGQFR